MRKRERARMPRPSLCFGSDHHREGALPDAVAQPVKDRIERPMRCAGDLAECWPHSGARAQKLRGALSPLRLDRLRVRACHLRQRAHGELAEPVVLLRGGRRDVREPPLAGNDLHGVRKLAVHRRRQQLMKHLEEHCVGQVHARLERIKGSQPRPDRSHTAVGGALRLDEDVAMARPAMLIAVLSARPLHNLRVVVEQYHRIDV
mmetsp:Transcript_18642/g.42766  ORF Transcript_18642/g.42766 Transcript_18642/m.42766 type:complete len:204 (-) Transcript_18642:445-1056(-)